jgi:hypothetical protein
MQISRLFALTALGVVLATAVHAQGNRPDLTRPKDVVDRIRPVDPPIVSTGTVVQPLPRPPQQMPRGGSDIERMRRNPPPPPAKK